MSRRVLIIGERFQGSGAFYFLRGFRKLGVEACILDPPGTRYRLVEAALRKVVPRSLDKVKELIVRRQIAVHLDRQEKAGMLWPDLVLVMGGHLVSDSCLRMLKQRTQAQLVHYNGDAYTSTAYQNVTDILRAALTSYDYLVCSKDNDYEVMSRQKGKRALYVPFAYDDEVFYPRKCARSGNLVFVGKWHPLREEIFSQCREFTPQIYGPLWQRSSLPAAWLHPLVDDSTAADLYSRFRVTVNIMSPENMDTTNMRTFEAPACGILSLHPDNSEYRRLFGDAAGETVYGSMEDLRRKLQAFLGDERLRTEVADEAHRVLVSGCHTYKDRCRELLSKIASWEEEGHEGEGRRV